MLIILLIARPFEDALHLVQSIAAPMMVTNTVGAALFMRILLDKRAMFEKYTSAFSATAAEGRRFDGGGSCARGSTKRTA